MWRPASGGIGAVPLWTCIHSDLTGTARIRAPSHSVRRHKCLVSTLSEEHKIGQNIRHMVIDLNNYHKTSSITRLIV
jgi:hypothetical protein